jgi:hypothetical protein
MVFAAPGTIQAPDGLALLVAGAVVLGFTLFQAARRGPPPMSLPQLTGAHLRGMLAWLIIVVVALVIVWRRG